jgi:multiple sugar transport system substrate-binding protein
MILTGITWDHPRGYAPLIASSKQYEELFGITVQWEKRSLTHFGDQSLESLARRFDLLIIDHPHIGMAKETDCLVPFNKLLEERKLKALEEDAAGPSFASYTYVGLQWAIPVDAAVQCSSYRPDLFGDLKIPAGWDEVFTLSEILDKKKLKVGIALCPTDCLCSFLSITAQLGSPIREGNKMLVEIKTGLSALALLRRMRDRFHEECLNWNPIQMYDHMCDHDDVAFSPLAFGYNNYSRKGFRNKELIFGAAPGTAHAVLGGAGMAVSSHSAHPEASAEYAAWIASPAIQSSLYVAEQGQPSSITAWKSGTANLQTLHFFENVLDTLREAYVRPRYRGWPLFQTRIGEIVHKFLKEDGDPAKTMEQLQDEYSISYRINT